MFWASDPVRPDETVLVQGCDLGKAAVELARLEDDAQAATGGAANVRWVPVPVLQASASSLKFAVPADWKPGVFACRARNQEGDSGVVLLNAPDPWWTQGDEGAGATPGGWLRVFGKALHFGRSSALRLEPRDGKPITLEAVAADCYALRFVLPADLKPGQYAIHAHNGFGGQPGWRSAGTIRIDAPPAWPAKRFSVLDFYGKDAEAEMHRTLLKYRPIPDRTEGIEAALKKAKDNGGGSFTSRRAGMASRDRSRCRREPCSKGKGRAWWCCGGEWAGSISTEGASKGWRGTLTGRKRRIT